MKHLLLLIFFVYTTFSEPVDEASIQSELVFTQNLHCELNELKSSFAASKSFEIYEKEFFDQVNSFVPSLINDQELQNNLEQSKIIVMADNHVSYGSQSNTVSLIKKQSKLSNSLHLVIEWIDRSYQAVVNQYLIGQLSLEELKHKIQFDKLWAFSWSSYKRILQEAKQNKVAIHLVENLKHTKDLTSRDDEITKLVKKLSKQNQESQILVVYGTYHVLGKNHLLDRFLKIDPQTIAIVSQAEQAYWQILNKIKNSEKLKQFSLSKDVYYLHDSKPLHQLQDERLYYLKLLGWDEDEYFCD